MTEWCWLLTFCIPGLLAFLYWLYGKSLLLVALVKYKRRGIAGILVTSNSPNWDVYIHENWIAHVEGRLIVLNWSERKGWKNSLSVNLYSRFCSYDKNYCPAVILFRGLRYPLVFRFFHAFRDYKHGDEAALRTLERRLFNELGLSDDGKH